VALSLYWTPDLAARASCITPARALMKSGRGAALGQDRHQLDVMPGRAAVPSVDPRAETIPKTMESLLIRS
jgi:hypothetical protein